MSQSVLNSADNGFESDSVLLNIKQSGLFMHWVDSGRRFAQGQGYSQSGALDYLHFYLANAMCGNTLSTPAIEILGGNAHFVIEQACWICVSGAPSEISINAQSIDINRPYYVAEKSVLIIAANETGIVNYLALRASVHLPLLFNSVCGVKREKAGGLHNNGEGLRANDSILGSAYASNMSAQASPQALEKFNIAPSIMKLMQMAFDKRNDLLIPIHFTYQEALFTHTEKALFLNSTFIITSQSDRMGIRLKGRAVACASKTLRSQPIANGAIQIPGDGMPIVMRNDRQSIGGYPVIATVSRVGLTLLAQGVSGQKIRFYEQATQQSHADYLLMYTCLQNLAKEVEQVLNEVVVK